MSDNDTNTAAPASTAHAYLQAATAILQAVGTDAAAIASGVGNTKVANHITSALTTFQGVQEPVQDLERLAFNLFGFALHLGHAHVAAKQAGG